MGKVLVAAFLAAMSCLAPASAQNLVTAQGFVAQLYIKKTNDRVFRFASPRILTAELYELSPSLLRHWQSGS